MSLNDLREGRESVIYFVVNNNPEAVIANLSAYGLLEGAPQDYTTEDLYFLLLSMDNNQVVELLSVPYINSASNDTAGYEEELVEGIYLQEGNRGALVLGIISGVLTLGSGFLQLQNSQTQQEIAETQLDALLAQQQAEEAKKILGLSPLAFTVVVLSVASIAITAIIVLNKKKK